MGNHAGAAGSPVFFESKETETTKTGSKGVLTWQDNQMKVESKQGTCILLDISNELC
jgi:hypothetical protein